MDVWFAYINCSCNCYGYGRIIINSLNIAPKLVASAFFIERNFLKKHRYIIILVALIIVSIVSIIKPEATEYVARAFLLLWGFQ